MNTGDTAAIRQTALDYVFEVQGNAASARIAASSWIDFLHLSKFNGRWVIVDVLWEMKPGHAFTPHW